MNSNNEQLQIVLNSGEIVPIDKSSIRSVQMIANPRPVQAQYQIQPRRQTMSVAEYRMLTDPRIRYNRKESIDPFWNNLGKAGVVLIGLLLSGAFVTILLAIVLNAAKPEPARVNQNCLAFCGGGNQF